MQKVRELLPGLLLLAAGRAEDMERQSKEQLTHWRPGGIDPWAQNKRFAM
jgi:hypothetical protein